MATAVIMPRQGQSVESCIITKWHKKEGDKVAVGDILFTYETDKSTFDEEAKVEGILLKILHGEDDDVPCLEDVCVIGAAGESVAVAAVSEAKVEVKAEATPVEVQAAAISASEPVKSIAAEGFVKISPRARNLAEKINIDYKFATPTGAEGRIIERDIDTLAKKGVPVVEAQPVEVKAEAKAEVKAVAVATDATSHTDEKLSNIRKVIAKQMLHSIQSTCQLTHTSSFDATEIQAFRKKLKPLVEKGEINNITLNDMIMFVVSRLLLKYKALNAHLLDDTMRVFDHVNLGMAVDTPRGLMVPTLFMADKISLNDMSAQLKTLASDCQKGSINPEKLSGGTFTVSNLGSLGVEHFTPVINVPQTGILGVNTITQRVKEVDGQIKMYPCMALSLTYDHRALDGAPASKFLRDVCNALENFTVSLATL